MNPATLSFPDAAPRSHDPRIEPLLDRIWNHRADEDAVAALTELAALLPAEDDKPMESPWHRIAVNLLIATLTYFWRERTDFYLGGNMFVYFFLGPQRYPRSRGPDFFYVNGVDRNCPRDKWIQWEELKFPHVILELLSPSTAQVDRTTKKDDYEHLEISEYFLYDPVSHLLEGWRLNPRGKYEAIQTDERGWMWSERLEMWLGNWTGSYQGTQAVWPRFYDVSGNLILNGEEAEQKRADDEQKRADDEQKRADDEQKRADDEQKRADDEQKRADALEAERDRLLARFAELERGPQHG